MIGYGVDLSHHQNPASVPWDRMRGTVDFVFARSSYGSRLRDKHCQEHVRRAREIGAKVGLYHFFRQSQATAEQWETMQAMAALVKLDDGDIVPAIDIELDPVPMPQPVSPEWEPRCRKLVELVVEAYGDAIVYITQREWGMLGKPAWVLERPLWVAHYTGATAPASPAGKLPHIWQHRVGPFLPNGPGGYDSKRPELDQNRLIQPLPLIGHARSRDLLSDADRARISGLVALTLDESIRSEGADESHGGERFRFA